MLCELYIENIAVIEKARITFENGLNVMTGETGAGKSIIIDSINAVLGERTSKDLIRSGCNLGRVSASFVNISPFVSDKLNDIGIPCNDDNSLTIDRIIYLNGKNSCKINGFSSSVTQLKAVGGYLIDIHGQHDSRALTEPEKHCEFIDSFADNIVLKSQYKNCFQSFIKAKKELNSLYDKRDLTLEKLDYLTYAIDEIEKANINPGELDELTKEKEIQIHSKKTVAALTDTVDSLTNESSVIEVVKKCANSLEKIGEILPDCTKLSEQMHEAEYILSDCSSKILSYIQKYDYSPQRIKEINDRLDVINALCAKYGKTEQDVLNFYNDAVSQKESLETANDSIEKKEAFLFDMSNKIKNYCSQLTDSRKKAALVFEKSVTNELIYLDMPNVVFKVDIKPVPLSVKGADNIEFYVSVNPGQEPKPLAKIASGGELSRIMLAVKNVLLSADYIDTLIFDEIDQGVSGSAADKIANKLYSVAQGKQVICVTHLAKIAAKADTHLKILKKYSNNSTFTAVSKLDFDERVAEIARITVGNDITELQLESAKEMLRRSVCK